jgi:tight adherence protein B
MIFIAALAVAISTWLFIPIRARARLGYIVENDSESTKSFGRLISLTSLADNFGSRKRKAVSKQRDETLAAISVLASELTAGHSPQTSLINVGSHVWPLACTAAGSGNDTAFALTLDARARPELRSLAACWQVGLNSGAGLGASISQLSIALRAQQEVRAHLEAELAGPRATAVTLGFLPVIGIGLGYTLGAEPLTWFFSGLFGLGTLLVGLALTLSGLWWTSRIAGGVEAML